MLMGGTSFTAFRGIDVQNDGFLGLIRRVRQGEELASEELVRTYGDQIRRIVRVRIGHSHLRRVVDSEDICQSVMANFLLRATAGEFELETPDQLFKLLVTMARNKLTNKFEYYQAARRDGRRNEAAGISLRETPGDQETPSVILVRDELVKRIRSLLTEEERELLDRRTAGESWPEIAAAMGDSAERLRKRLERATQRVANQLEVPTHNDG